MCDRLQKRTFSGLSELITRACRDRVQNECCATTSCKVTYAIHMTRLFVRWWCTLLERGPMPACYWLCRRGAGRGFSLAFPSASLLSAPSLSARANGPEAHAAAAPTIQLHLQLAASPCLCLCLCLCLFLTLFTRGQEKHPPRGTHSVLPGFGPCSALQGHCGQQESCCLAKLSTWCAFSSYAPHLIPRVRTR